MKNTTITILCSAFLLAGCLSNNDLPIRTGPQAVHPGDLVRSQNSPLLPNSGN